MEEQAFFRMALPLLPAKFFFSWSGLLTNRLQSIKLTDISLRGGFSF
jgi:hypothetical protein